MEFPLELRRYRFAEAAVSESWKWGELPLDLREQQQPPSFVRSLRSQLGVKLDPTHHTTD